jgi:ATP-dependent Clp protease ATP-binding subunit ClpA
MTPPPPTLQELIDTVRQDTSSQESLDLLITAAMAVAQLEETGDALLGHFVDGCRRSGHSWSEISQALGVTKQAVHKRFAVVADQLIASTPAPTLERFTPRARNVLAAAVRAAAPDAAGSEHVLLSLYTEPEGLAARALAAMRVSQDVVQAAILEHVKTAGTTGLDEAGQGATAPGRAEAGPDQPERAEAGPDQPGQGATGPDQPGPDETGPDEAGPAAAGGPAEGAAPASHGAQPAARKRFSADGQRVLRDALAAALELGHNYIGTEHLLIAIYRDRGGLAARVLRGQGAGETEVTELLKGMLADLAKGR